MLLGGAAGLGRPERLDLGEDPLAELVARPGERERRVGVQALEPAGARLAADPAWQLGTEAALLLVPAPGALSEFWVLAREGAPALDAAGGFDARERGDELRARQPVRRREGLAGLVVGRLLDDGRPAEGTTDRYTPESPGRAAKLLLDDRPVIHPCGS